MWSSRLFIETENDVRCVQKLLGWDLAEGTQEDFLPRSRSAVELRVMTLDPEKRLGHFSIVSRIFLSPRLNEDLE